MLFFPNFNYYLVIYDIIMKIINTMIELERSWCYSYICCTGNTRKGPFMLEFNQRIADLGSWSIGLVLK